MITQATIVTLGLFVIGLVFHAGEMRQRVITLEQRDEKFEGKLDHLLAVVDELKDLIREQRARHRNGD